jgi:hypothetical protein
MPWRRRVTVRHLVHAAPVLGAIAAYLVLEVVNVGKQPHPRAVPDGRLAVWEFLVTASVVVWLVLGVLGARMLRDREAVPGGTSWRWIVRGAPGYFAAVYGAVVFPLVFMGLTGLGNTTILAGQQWKNVVLHLAGAVAIFPLLVVIKQIELHADDDAAWSPGADAIERIARLRRSLHIATAALGAIVALAVIATGALRDAVLGAGVAAVPDTLVLVYGAWYTAVVAAIYLPAFWAIERRATRVLDDVAPLPDPDAATAQTFSERVAFRAEVAQQLGLDGNARENLEGLVVVMSPLIGAVLTRLGGL